MEYNYNDLQNQIETILSSGISESELLQLVDKAPTIFKYTPEGIKSILESLQPKKDESKQNHSATVDIEQLAIKNNIIVTPIDSIIDKVLKSPSDFYKKICEQLTPEERLFIAHNLENRNCMNCTNVSCRVPYREKIGIDESGKPQGSNCLGWSNDVLIGKCKVLKITDINKLK